MSTKTERLEAANRLIQVIASCGREFFKHDGFVARLELSESGRVFFIDYYTKKRIYTHWYCKHWDGFTGGGIMRWLTECLRDFITKDKKLFAEYFQPEMPNGFKNPLGYGDDILKVKKAAIELGIAE